MGRSVGRQRVGATSSGQLTRHAGVVRRVDKRGGPRRKRSVPTWLNLVRGRRRRTVHLDHPAGDEDDPRSGILIYTAVSDAEGALGGLVSQAEPRRLVRMTTPAMRDAMRCSSDPARAESDPVRPMNIPCQRRGALRAALRCEMGPESRCGPCPQIGNSLACAEFDRRAALAAVDNRGVELGDNRVVATAFRSKQPHLTERTNTTRKNTDIGMPSSARELGRPLRDQR